LANKELLENDSFCVLPWMHLYKHQDNNVKLCCVDKGGSIGSLETQTVDEIRNSEIAINLRQQFLDGEKPDRCSECWTQEDRGYTSYRQNFNEDFYRDYDNDSLTFKADEPLPIYYLDYRPSNLCNLACKICSPEYSIKLIEPHLELGTINKEQAKKMSGYSKNRVSIDTVMDNIDDVDYFYFAGGEPLITDDHWDILQNLVDKKQFDIRIKYNTNLTRLSYKDKHVKNYWNKFRLVVIAASLDGYGTGFEHIRTGGKWDDIVSNLDTLKEMMTIRKNLLFKRYGHQKKNYGIELNIDSTVGWLNLKSVFKLHKFLVKEKYVILDDENFTKLVTKPLIYPYGSSLSNTPPELKDELLESIDDYKVWLNKEYRYGNHVWINDITALENTIKDSKYNEDHLVNWIKWHQVLDKKYKLNTAEAFKFKNEEWNFKFSRLYNKKFNTDLL